MGTRLANKVVIITGAATGIGRAAALLFAEEGASVVVVDQDVEGGGRTVQQIMEKGGTALFVRTNLVDANQVAEMVKKVIERFGHIDVLYNNAGVNHFGKIADVKEEDWDRVMTVNVKSVYLTCKYVIPHMQKAGKGTIINTASSAALVGLRNLSAYTASKGAVLQLTRNIALDYAKDGIRANALCPGVTATEMTEKVILSDPDPVAARQRFNRVIPRGSMASPEELARAALFLASDESSYILGAAIPVDGGYTAE